jgi:hypothetical protein
LGDLIFTQGGLITRIVQEYPDHLYRGRPRPSRNVKESGTPGRQRHRFRPLSGLLCGKWMELLKEAVPGIRRVDLFFQPP